MVQVPKNSRVIERVKEWLEEEGIEIVKPRPIEIKEITPQKLNDPKEIEELWKGFGPRACLKCGKEEEFQGRYFILSRCPKSREEEEWLGNTMKKQYRAEHYGIAAGVLSDNWDFFYPRDVIQNWQTTEDIKTWTLFANSALASQSCPSGRITCSYLASPSAAPKSLVGTSDMSVTVI